MDAIMELQLTPTQLVQINACRMHLQVNTLAEITDHTGTNLLPQAFVQPTDDKPAGLDDISQSRLTWPNTNPPPANVGDCGHAPYVPCLPARSMVGN